MFVVGAPRSGTTWVQTMLGAHPAIVSPQETGVVPHYVAPMAARFDQEVAAAAQAGSSERVVGLPVVLTRAQLRGTLREVLASVARAALELKPGAHIVVEKTPDNARHVELIQWLSPDARFIHMIRDGRDVAASLLAASASWGGRWAPNDVRRAAQVWKDHVLGGRDAAREGDRYTEVRYSDLQDEGPTELARLFAHCGVEVTEDDASEICERFTFERMASSTASTFDSVVVGGAACEVAKGPAREPEGFYRVGRSGSWRAWGPGQCWAFDEVAGDLLVELGFEPDRAWATPSRTRERAQRAVTRRARRASDTSRQVARRLARRALAAS